MAHAEPVDQDLLDEGRRAQLAQTRVESQAQHTVHAFRGEQLELVTQARQTRRRRIGGEELTRLRLENHHTAGQRQFRGTLAQTHQDGLMAAVDTVEIPDRGDATPMLGPQIM